LTEEEEGNAPKGPPRTKHEVLHALFFAFPHATLLTLCVLWQVDPAAVDVDVVDVGDPVVTYFDPSDLAGLAPSSSSFSSSSSSSSSSAGPGALMVHRHSCRLYFLSLLLVTIITPALPRHSSSFHPRHCVPRAPSPPRPGAHVARGRPRRGGPGAVPPGRREHHRRPGPPHLQVPTPSPHTYAHSSCKYPMDGVRVEKQS
jgi:hypothetical protein